MESKALTISPTTRARLQKPMQNIRNTHTPYALERFRAALDRQSDNAAGEVVEMIKQNSLHAMGRLSDLTDSSDENIVFKSAAFIVDHLIGKAPQHNTNANVNVNIDVLAS